MAYETDDSQDDMPLPGPRGQRMMQLGLLTKAQKKRPVIPDTLTDKEGSANPGSVENAKLQSSLAEKVREQKMAAINRGPSSTVSEADPMKKSYTSRFQR